METVEKQTTVFPPFPQPLLLLTKSVKDVLITKRKGCLDNQHTEGRPLQKKSPRFVETLSCSNMRFLN
jgi:hypothetical protein